MEKVAKLTPPKNPHKKASIPHNPASTDPKPAPKNPRG